MIKLDLMVAFSIIGIVVIIFIVSQIKGIPRTSRLSLFFIIAGVASVFGLSLFREHRMKALRKELKEREKRLKEQEKRLALLKDEYQISEEKLNQLRAKLNEQRAAYEKLILQIKAENKAEKERIENLAGEDLHNEFLATFGSE